MIARLIREHDRDNRLEGFLKITQAAQTDALVRVLDEKLARYLAQVLDDNLEGLVGKSAKRRTLVIAKKPQRGRLENRSAFKTLMKSLTL